MKTRNIERCSECQQAYVGDGETTDFDDVEGGFNAVDVVFHKGNKLLKRNTTKN